MITLADNEMRSFTYNAHGHSLTLRLFGPSSPISGAPRAHVEIMRTGDAHYVSIADCAELAEALHRAISKAKEFIED